MLNKLILQGRLVASIETKTTKGGTAFAEFTIAWSEKIKEIENKCFMRCKAWGSTATFLEKYFVKGQEILIEGQVRTEEWEKDGQKQSRTICNIEKVHFCGSAKQSTTSQVTVNQNSNSNQQQGFVDITVDEEDLPF